VVSVVIPFFNEEENAEPVLAELVEVLRTLEQSWEVIAVDDGSTDRTLVRLQRVRRKTAGLRILRMRRNAGQTAAMQAGFDAVRGQVVVTLDGDGQNDPSAIPRILEKIDEGYDLVCGWRHHRQDRWLSRKLPSRLANRLIATVTGVPIHDNGCSLKAYRTALLRRIHLYAEQHRFIPALASLQGARIAEIRVPHRRRRAGSSKYGLSRTYKVLLDLVTVWSLRRLSVSPSIPFLAMGAVSLMAGGLAAALTALAAQRNGSVVVWSGTALLLFYLAGYQFMLAFLAELLRQTPGVEAAAPMPGLRRRVLIRRPRGESHDG